MPSEASEPQRILVVDDEPDITALVAYHLAKEGYRVTTAGTGADALRAAREERPDMVVLDLMLPGHSGFEVLAELRRRDRVQPRAQLLETVGQAQPDIQTRTVDMHVQRLRSKLGDAGEWIETVRAVGYRFREPAPPPRRKRA